MALGHAMRESRGREIQSTEHRYGLIRGTKFLISKLGAEYEDKRARSLKEVGGFLISPKPRSPIFLHLKDPAFVGTVPLASLCTLRIRSTNEP